MANSNRNFDINLKQSNLGKALYAMNTEQLLNRYFARGNRQTDLYSEMLPQAGKLDNSNQYVYQTLARLSADNLCCLFTTIDKLTDFLPEDYYLKTDVVINDINTLLSEYKDFALDAAFGNRTPFTVSFSKHFTEDLLLPALKLLRNKVANNNHLV